MVFGFAIFILWKISKDGGHSTKKHNIKHCNIQFKVCFSNASSLTSIDTNNCNSRVTRSAGDAAGSSAGGQNEMELQVDNSSGHNAQLVIF